MFLNSRNSKNGIASLQTEYVIDISSVKKGIFTCFTSLFVLFFLKNSIIDDFDTFFSLYGYTSTHWFSDTPVHLKDCNPCSFKPFNKNSSSTPHDLILTVGINSLDGGTPFIKSLRATNTNATIVILVDTKTLETVDPRMIRIFEKCGAVIIDAGFYSFPSEDKVKDMRFGILNKFLRACGSFFNRVVVVDLVDTVFQGDPFTAEYNWSKLNIGHENIQIRKENITKNLIKEIPNINHTYFMKKQVLNSGVIWGNPESIIEIFEHLLQYMNTNQNNETTSDQGFFNVVVHSGDLKKDGIEYSLHGPNTAFSTIALNLNNFSNADLGKIKHYKRKNPTLLIHQYDRSLQIIETIIRHCPTDGLNASQFIRIKYCDQYYQKYIVNRTMPVEEDDYDEEREFYFEDVYGKK